MVLRFSYPYPNPGTEDGGERRELRHVPGSMRQDVLRPSVIIVEGEKCGAEPLPPVLYAGPRCGVGPRLARGVNVTSR